MSASSRLVMAALERLRAVVEQQRVPVEIQCVHGAIADQCKECDIDMGRIERESFGGKRPIPMPSAGVRYRC